MIKRILSTNTLPPSADASVKNFVSQRKRVIGSDGRNIEIIKDRGLSLPKHQVLSYPKIPKLFKTTRDSKLMKIVQNEYFKFASPSDNVREKAAESPIESSLNVDPTLSFSEDIDKASQVLFTVSENSVTDLHTLNWLLRVDRENSKNEKELAPSKKPEASDQKTLIGLSNLNSTSESVHLSNVHIIDVMNKRLSFKFPYSLPAEAKHDEIDVYNAYNLKLREPHFQQHPEESRSCGKSICSKMDKTKET